MSDLVGNPEDRFSQNEAHIFDLTILLQKDADKMANSEDPDQTVSLIQVCTVCQDLSF